MTLYYNEEFIIDNKQWKDRIQCLEKIISIQTQHFRDQEPFFSRNTFFSVNFQIFFIIYKTPATGRLLGLGIRIITPDNNTSIALAMTPEERVQKVMYLLSRGLLRSFYHRIEQVESPIPI